MPDISTVYKKHINLCNTKWFWKKDVCKVCKEDKNWSHLGLALKIPFFLDITTFEDKQMRLK